MFLYRYILGVHLILIFRNFYINKFCEIDSLDIFWEFETREFQESIERITHTMKGSDTLFDEGHILGFCISEKLEIPWHDSKRSLEFMTSIMYEVVHCIDIISNWFQSFANEESSHKEEGKENNPIHNEKPQYITEDIFKWISSFAYEDFVSARIRKGRLIEEEIIFTFCYFYGEIFDGIFIEKLMNLSELRIGSALSLNESSIQLYNDRINMRKPWSPSFVSDSSFYPSLFNLLDFTLEPFLGKLVLK